MKAIKERKKFLGILMILSIIAINCLVTNVYATDHLVDLTANGTGQTNTGNAGGNTGNIGGTNSIEEINQPTFSTVNQTVYATANTNIKSSYSTTSSTIGTLTKDQSITRTGVSNNGWSRVVMSNGTIGYVETASLTTTAPSTTTPPANNNNNSSLYNNTNTNTDTLPKTGIGDNTGMYIIMGICVVAAIYAYKKIRDYNI